MNYDKLSEWGKIYLSENKPTANEIEDDTYLTRLAIANHLLPATIILSLAAITVSIIAISMK